MMSKSHSSENTKKPLTVPEVAKKIGVHPVTFRRWCEAGHGPKHLTTPGNHRLFRQEDVETWLLAAEMQRDPDE